MFMKKFSGFFLVLVLLGTVAGAQPIIATPDLCQSCEGNLRMLLVQLALIK